MSNEDQENVKARRDSIKDARDALKRGDLDMAQMHLDIAMTSGALPSQTEPVVKAIQAAKMARAANSRGGAWRGFWVALLGYLCIAIRQPLGWGMPLWIFLTFVLVPIVAGLVVGRYQKANGGQSQSFVMAFKGVGKAMALYTIMSLIFIGGSHSDADKWQERIAGILATALYFFITGLVAGATSMAVSGVQFKERVQ